MWQPDPSEHLNKHKSFITAFNFSYRPNEFEPAVQNRRLSRTDCTFSCTIHAVLYLCRSLAILLWNPGTRIPCSSLRTARPPSTIFCLIQQYKQNVNYQKGLVDGFQTVWQIFYKCICMKSVANVVKRGRLRWFGQLEHKGVDDWVAFCRNVVVAGVRRVGRGRKTWGKRLTLA